MAKPDFQLKWGVNRVGGIPATDPADYQLGWQYRGGLPPLTGNFDYYQNLADDRLLYLNAQGIAEWDALTAYDTDAYVKGSDGELYRSTAPTTGNDPTLGGPWERSLSGIGDGQSWNDVTVSRMPSVIYTNTTGRSIFVMIRLISTSTLNNATVNVDSIPVGFVANNNADAVQATVSLIVPNLSTYSVDLAGAATIQQWSELA